MALDWSPRCPIECGPRPRSYALGVLAPVAPAAPAWRSEGGCGRIRSVCYGACGLCAMNRVPSIQGNRRACVPCTMHRPSMLVSAERTEISRFHSPPRPARRCSRPSHTTSLGPAASSVGAERASVRSRVRKEFLEFLDIGVKFLARRQKPGFALAERLPARSLCPYVTLTAHAERRSEIRSCRRLNTPHTHGSYTPASGPLASSRPLDINEHNGNLT